jgi:hypothetical protein
VDKFKYTDPLIPVDPAPVMATAPNGGTLGLYVVGTVAHFLAAATGNVDNENAIQDSWWISSETFPAQATACTSGIVENNAGGQPFNSQNDVACD